MTGSNRIKGDKLALSFGGTDYWADHTSVKLDNEEANGSVTTFADAAAGGARLFFFALAAIQSLMAGSFWRYAWANTGNTVAFRYAPHGNEIATADQPHFTGTLKIGPKPAVGGDAGSDDYTFETRWDVVGEPVLDVGASGAASITAITPTGKAVGDAVQITGTRFTGATDVKFAAVSATQIIVLSDTVIIARIPAGTGAKAVTVITPAGTSASVSYTVA